MFWGACALANKVQCQKTTFKGGEKSEFILQCKIKYDYRTDLPLQFSDS